MNVPLNTNKSESDNPPFGPDYTPYEAIGGDERVRALTDTFYDIMDERYPALRALHEENLEKSRQRLYEFLSGWLGGPQLFIQRHGHPRLRMRHAHVAIDQSGVDDWLACMGEAMDELGIEGDLRGFLDTRFAHTANFMRNK